MKKTKITRLMILVKNLDGGTGTFAAMLANYFRKSNDYEVCLLSIQAPQYGLKKTKIDAYFSRNAYGKYSLVILIKFFLKEILWLAQQLNYFKPTTVLSIDTHSIVLVEVLRWWKRNTFSSIHTIHNNLKAVYIHKVNLVVRMVLLLPVIRWLLNRSNRVVCVSNDLARHVQRYLNLRNQPLCIYNGIETDQAGVLPNKFAVLKKDHVFSFLTVCRIDQQKDLETLLRAMNHLRLLIRTPFTLTIVGDGPRKSDVAGLMRKLNLESIVSLVGWKNNINDFYQQSDIFILSSHWEGLPYVLLEAMRHGLPIVASDCDFGPREIIGHHDAYGHLFPPGDYQTLAQVLTQIMTNHRNLQHLSRKSLSRVKAFSLHSQLTCYKKLIESM